MLTASTDETCPVRSNDPIEKIEYFLADSRWCDSCASDVNGPIATNGVTW